MSRFICRCLKPVSAVMTLGSATGAYADPVSLQHEVPSTVKAESNTVADQNSNQQRGEDTSSGRIERVHVIGHPFNTLHAGNDMGRMPQDIMHTAQTIDVVPRELIQQQNAKSLDEALKNVPGITSSVGEGAGGMNGDQFLIRGFPAQNDIYEDGLRDFGVYTRDNFDYDSINVIKGPSSEVFGNGTTGGAINAVTKAPTLTNHYGADFSGGSGQYYRGTVDVNQRLGDHSAFRIEGMGNSNNVVGREGVFSHRWGIAPSVAFGLGTKSTLVFQVMHLSEKSVPDYGVPVVKLPGSAIGRPITEYGIPRQNWYGKDQDRNKTSDTMETIRFTHHFNSHFTLHDDLRFGEFSRDFTASKVVCGAACVNALASGNWASGVVNRTSPSKIAGTNYYSSVPQPYKQWSWSVQNVASLQADFNTGFLKHQLISGVDMEYVHDTRHQYAYASPIAAANLLNPNSNVGSVTRVRGDTDSKRLYSIPGLGTNADSHAYAFDTGIFLYDQVWFTKWMSVKGGFRWDRWQTEYTSLLGNSGSAEKNLPNTTNVINPSASLLITPNKRQTFYFTYSSSTTPTGMYVTSGSIPIRPAGASGAYVNKPERAQLYEVGTKLTLLHDRLGVTGTMFRLDKSNALTADPIGGGTISTGDQQRNQGFEFSVGGMVLPGWNVTATYALYDPKTRSGSSKGKLIQYVPHNQATLWSAYEAFPGKPWNFTVGGGVTWRQGVWLDTANTQRVPANVEFDTVLSHRLSRHWVVSLNGYNLSNRLNYSSLFTGYSTPAPGRSFLGRLSMDY